MPLTPEQTDKIDQMIWNNAKRADILTALVQVEANLREVEEYLKENKTLQGMLNTVTRRAKEITMARTEEERRQLADEIADLAKAAIRILQKKAGQ